MTASRGPDTRVTLSFTVPAGAALDSNPRFRITDAKGQTIELLPAHVAQGLPAGTAYRDLHTELYPPGVYQVRAEVVLAQNGVSAGGSTAVTASAPVAMTVLTR